MNNNFGLSRFPADDRWPNFSPDPMILSSDEEVLSDRNESGNFNFDNLSEEQVWALMTNQSNPQDFVTLSDDDPARIGFDSAREEFWQYNGIDNLVRLYLLYPAIFISRFKEMDPVDLAHMLLPFISRTDVPSHRVLVEVVRCFESDSRQNFSLFLRKVVRSNHTDLIEKTFACLTAEQLSYALGIVGREIKPQEKTIKKEILDAIQKGLNQQKNFTYMDFNEFLVEYWKDPVVAIFTYFDSLGFNDLLLKAHEYAEEFDGLDERFSITDKLIGHIFGDTFIGSSWLQGATLHDTTEFLVQFMQTTLKSGERLCPIDDLDSLIPLFQMVGDYSKRLSLNTLKEISEEVAKTLKTQSEMLLPGGWKDVLNGHALLYHVVRQPDGNYSFSIYNTGAGTCYHAMKVGTVVKVNPRFTLCNIPAQRLESSIFWEGLFGFQCILQKDPSKKYGGKDIYGYLKGMTAGQRVDDSTVPISQYIRVQFSGICAWKVLMGFCVARLPRSKYRLMTFYLKLASLALIYRDFDKKHKQQTPQRILSDDALIVDAMQKFAHSVARNKLQDLPLETRCLSVGLMQTLKNQISSERAKKTRVSLDSVKMPSSCFPSSSFKIPEITESGRSLTDLDMSLNYVEEPLIIRKEQFYEHPEELCDTLKSYIKFFCKCQEKRVPCQYYTFIGKALDELPGLFHENQEGARQVFPTTEGSFWNQIPENKIEEISTLLASIFHTLPGNYYKGLSQRLFLYFAVTELFLSWFKSQANKKQKKMSQIYLFNMMSGKLGDSLQGALKDLIETPSLKSESFNRIMQMIKYIEIKGTRCKDNHQTLYHEVLVGWEQDRNTKEVSQVFSLDPGHPLPNMMSQLLALIGKDQHPFMKQQGMQIFIKEFLESPSMPEIFKTWRILHLQLLFGGRVNRNYSFGFIHESKDEVKIPILFGKTPLKETPDQYFRDIILRLSSEFLTLPTLQLLKKAKDFKHNISHDSVFSSENLEELSSILELREMRVPRTLSFFEKNSHTLLSSEGRRIFTQFLFSFEVKFCKGNFTKLNSRFMHEIACNNGLLVVKKIEAILKNVADSALRNQDPFSYSEIYFIEMLINEQILLLEKENGNVLIPSKASIVTLEGLRQNLDTSDAASYFSIGKALIAWHKAREEKDAEWLKDILENLVRSSQSSKTLSLYSSLRHMVHEKRDIIEKILNGLDPESRERLLTGLCEKQGVHISEHVKWEGCFPEFSSGDYSLNIEQGSVYKSGVAIQKVQNLINSNGYRAVFGTTGKKSFINDRIGHAIQPETGVSITGVTTVDKVSRDYKMFDIPSSFLRAKISNEYEVFLDERGLSSKYVYLEAPHKAPREYPSELISFWKELVKDLPQFFDHHRYERWLAFGDQASHHVFLLDTEDRRVLKITWSEEKGKIVQDLTNQWTLCQTPTVDNSNPMYPLFMLENKEFLCFWVDAEKQLSAIDLPRYKLNFVMGKNSEETRSLFCKQFPGYYLEPARTSPFNYLDCTIALRKQKTLKALLPVGGARICPDQCAPYNPMPVISIHQDVSPPFPFAVYTKTMSTLVDPQENPSYGYQAKRADLINLAHLLLLSRNYREALYYLKRCYQNHQGTAEEESRLTHLLEFANYYNSNPSHYAVLTHALWLRIISIKDDKYNNHHEIDQRPGYEIYYKYCLYYHYINKSFKLDVDQEKDLGEYFQCLSLNSKGVLSRHFSEIQQQRMLGWFNSPTTNVPFLKMETLTEESNQKKKLLKRCLQIDLLVCVYPVEKKRANGTIAVESDWRTSHFQRIKPPLAKTFLSMFHDYLKARRDRNEDDLECLRRSLCYQSSYSENTLLLYFLAVLNAGFSGDIVDIGDSKLQKITNAEANSEKAAEDLEKWLKDVILKSREKYVEYLVKNAEDYNTRATTSIEFESSVPESDETKPLQLYVPVLPESEQMKMDINSTLYSRLPVSALEGERGKKIIGKDVGAGGDQRKKRCIEIEEHKGCIRKQPDVSGPDERVVKHRKGEMGTIFDTPGLEDPFDKILDAYFISMDSSQTPFPLYNIFMNWKKCQNHINPLLDQLVKELDDDYQIASKMQKKFLWKQEPNTLSVVLNLKVILQAAKDESREARGKIESYINRSEMMKNQSFQFEVIEREFVEIAKKLSGEAQLTVDVAVEWYMTRTEPHPVLDPLLRQYLLASIKATHASKAIEIAECALKTRGCDNFNPELSDQEMELVAVLQKRHLDIHEQGEGHDKLARIQLYFEYKSAKILRSKQFDLIHRGVKQLRQAFQLGCGEGKTKILTVLLELIESAENNLVVNVVPSSNFEENYSDSQQALTTISTRRVNVFRFNREIKTSQDSLRLLFREFDGKNPIITEPSSIQSLLLKYIEELYLLCSDEAKGPKKNKVRRKRIENTHRTLLIFEGALSRLMENSTAIVDEVHEVLKVDHHLNYTLKDETTRSVDSWEIPQLIFSHILSLNAAEEKHSFPIWESSYCLWDENIYHSSLKIQLAKSLSREPSLQLSQEEQPLFQSYLIADREQLSDEKRSLFRNWLDLKPEETRKKLQLLRAHLNVYLPHALGLRLYVNYGPLDNLEEAIPYENNMSPFKKSTFQNWGPTVVLTYVLYLREGLRRDQVKRLIHTWQAAHNSELYISSAGEKNRETEASRKFTEKYKKIPLHAVNTKKEKDFEEIYQAFAKDVPTIFEYLQYYLFPSLPAKKFNQNSNAQDLAGTLFKKIIAFSGTPVNHLTYPIDMPCIFDPGASGSVLRVLSQPEQVSIEVVEMLDVAEQVRKTNPCIFLDPHAMLEGIPNDCVAKDILAAAPEHITHVLYFDPETNKMVTLNRKGSISLYDHEASSENARITYCDQKHCTGTDIIQPKKGVGCLLVAKGLSLTELLQAAKRLRSLGDGQKIKLVITREVADEIIQKCHVSVISLEAVIFWTMLNEIAFTSKTIPESLHQQIRNVYRRRALRNLIGLSKHFSEESAVEIIERRMATFNKYRALFIDEIDHEEFLKISSIEKPQSVLACIRETFLKYSQDYSDLLLNEDLDELDEILMKAKRLFAEDQPLADGDGVLDATVQKEQEAQQEAQEEQENPNKKYLPKYWSPENVFRKQEFRKNIITPMVPDRSLYLYLGNGFYIESLARFFPEGCFDGSILATRNFLRRNSTGSASSDGSDSHRSALSKEMTIFRKYFPRVEYILSIVPRNKKTRRKYILVSDYDAELIRTWFHQMQESKSSDFATSKNTSQQGRHNFILYNIQGDAWDGLEDRSIDNGIMRIFAQVMFLNGETHYSGPRKEALEEWLAEGGAEDKKRFFVSFQQQREGSCDFRKNPLLGTVLEGIFMNVRR